MSNTPRLILISGWAHTASDLENLRKRITPPATVVSTADLWSAAGAGERPSVYARNLKAMIEKSEGQIFVAGWSLGGMIALEAALNWPELFAGLILISSTPKFCVGPGWPAGTPGAAMRAMLGGLKRNPRGVFKTFFENVAAFSKDAEDALKARLESAGAMNLHELAYGLEYLRDMDFNEPAKNLRLPALIIHGRRDAIINVDAARQLNRLLALSRLRIYDEHGHGLPWQNPQEAARDIMGFIAECAARKNIF